MDQMNLAPKDLIQYIGSKSKVSEVLSGKRMLSLTMIRRLNEGLGIPIPQLASEIGISAAAVEKNISRLKKNGYVKRTGSAKAGRWQVSGPGNDKN